MGRKILEQSKGFTKKDFLNCRNGESLQDYTDKTLKVISSAIIEDSEEDGNVKTVGVLITDAGVLTTISDNVIESIRDLHDLEEDGEYGPGNSPEVKVVKRKSKQGRDFLCLRIE